MDSVLLFGAQCKGIRLTATTTSAAVSMALPVAGDTLHLQNLSTDDAYFSVGVGAQTATLPSSTASITSCCIFGRSDVPFRIPRGSILEIAALTSAGSAVLNAYVGEGS